MRTPYSTSNNTLPLAPPAEAFKRVSEKIANGKVDLYPCNERVLEQFLAFKLAVPGLSDEAAASLLIAGAMDTLDVNTFNCN